MKDKIIEAIRAVPIAGKTYEEYVEAVADRLLAERILPGYVRFEAKAFPATLNVKYTAVGMKERCAAAPKNGTPLTLIRKAYKDGGRQAAREIIAEIEDARERWETVYARDYFGYGGDAFCYLQTDVDHTIYEIKKKYTEEK